MAKPPRVGDGQNPMAARLPGLGGSVGKASAGGLLPHAGFAAPDLESFLSKGPNLKLPRPSKPADTTPGMALEAQRCASEGVRLMQQGRPTDAIPLFKQAIKLNPGVAASHHDLGVAMVAAGRLEQAAGPLAASLRLNPRLASAHQYLGHISDSLGQEAKAMASFRCAVALRPNLASVQLRLGQLYLARDRREESAAAFRAAAMAAPGTVTASIAEALALEASGAFDEALAEMRAVVEAHPANAKGHGMLAKLLGESGLSAEAAAHYERAAELSPGSIDAWSGVATHRKFTADDGPLVMRMNAALTRPGLTARQRIALHFALGKAHDDMGNYAAAMRDFDAGNRLRALSGRLDRAEHAQRVDRLIEATPPGFLDRQPSLGVEDATPILIVGMPRSGTTLIEQMISAHPEVAAGGELRFWHALADSREDIWSLTATAEATRSLAGDYLTRLRAIGPDAKRVTDKMPQNFMLLGFIHRIFPNATLVHSRRHPIDVALSIFTTNFGTPFDFAAVRSDLVFYIRQYQRLMGHWREVLPPDRFVEVDYEALVADPEPQARQLVAACGLAWNDACLAPNENARKITTASAWQARQLIYRTSVDRWLRYERWLGELRDLEPKLNND
jgi:tetratricopeptide (TPR) repeat protein